MLPVACLRKNISSTGYDMDEPRGRYAKWNQPVTQGHKPVPKEQTLHNSTYRKGQEQLDSQRRKVELRFQGLAGGAKGSFCNPNFFFLSNKKKFLWILGGSTFWTAWTWDWAADQYSVHQSENSLVECDGRLKIVNRELYCKHFWVALKMAKTLFNERIESCGISSSWYQKVDVSRTATRKCG